jgi:hypothetical protein
MKPFCASKGLYRKCLHARCSNRALPRKNYCKYCMIYDVAHFNGKMKHLHCKKERNAFYECTCCCKRGEKT